MNHFEDIKNLTTKRKKIEKTNQIFHTGIWFTEDQYHL